MLTHIHVQFVFFSEMLDLQKYLHQVRVTHVPSIVDNVLHVL